MSTQAARMVEALYDPATGVTFVRHPEDENSWVEVSLIKDVIRHCPTASAAGDAECEVHTHFPHGGTKSSSKTMKLHLMTAGQHGALKK
jgi:hypothetical protein